MSEGGAVGAVGARAAVLAEGLSKRFGSTNAVLDLHLEVAAGEIFGLVGPDGAGKTTVLRLLAALMRPSAGDVSVLGFSTTRRSSAIKQRIGYMAQRFSLYGDLTVLENLQFYADLFRVRGPKRKERIERLLGFARLGEFRGRRAGHLSGGMQKKLALACTLVHEPELILLDEPTTGVDPVSRREFWDILSELHAQNMTIVVSTPYMDEAERCARVGLMYAGRMIVCDTPAEIKARVEGELVAIWPANVRAAQRVLQATEGVLEVQTFGDQLRVFVVDAQGEMDRLRTTLEGAGIACHDMQRVPARMEEAFVSLVQAQGKQGIESCL